MIALYMNQPDFENDIRALLMAFFYGVKIVREAQEDWEYRLDVCYDHSMVSMNFTDTADRSMALEGPAEIEDYKKGRNQVKRVLYDLLSSYTGKTLPWGTLTGIRPTKIPMEMFEAGYDENAAVQHMMDAFSVTEEKASLSAEIARREKRIMEGIDFDSTYSLYVGIPFCPSICAYCSFSSYPLKLWEKEVDHYLDALEKEIRAAAGMLAHKHLETFYMGGGTPTSLTALQMDRLLTCLEENFNLADCSEMTIEAGRPDSITKDKLQVIYDHGIRRISINPQTMNQETLDLIGRRHSTRQIREAYRMAREIGFTNINMDLIAGLPGETCEHMRRTMDEIVSMAPDSLTVHSLALKRAAFLNQNREQFPVAEADEVNRMIGISRSGARSIGLNPYYLYRQKNIAGNLENVGYSREGCEGLYNILIMEEKHTILALGAGASSKFVMERRENGQRIERVENVKSVKDYIERIDEMIQRKMDFVEANREYL